MLRDLVRSWWILLTVIPLGWFAWGGILFAGIRARRKAWIVFGLVYLVLIAGGTAMTGIKEIENTTAQDLAVSAWLFSWFATFVHALIIRRPYLDRMAVLEDLRLARGERRLIERETALDLVEEDPRRAREVGVGRPDVPGAFDGGIVDLNHASADALARLPGFDRRRAKRAVRIREEINGFESVDDVSLFLDIPAPDIERLRERTVCLPM